MILDEKITNYFGQVYSQFPGMGDYEMPGNGIALGSSYSHMASNDTRFLAFCSRELDI
jgi:hypothetical protein